MSSDTIAATEPSANKRSADMQGESVNWLGELRGLALMLLAVFAFHSFVAKPFYIPSTSMLPRSIVTRRGVAVKNTVIRL